MEEEKQSGKIYKIIMVILITAFITFFVTSLSMYSYFTKNNDGFVVVKSDKSSTDIENKLSKFKSMIDKYFLGNVDENKLEEGAIKGYIEALDDPYTEYISKEDMKDYTSEILGNFVGIGIYMVKDETNNKISVLSPIKDSPAEKAGILPGDLIVKVDGVEYTADDMTVAANKIKGENGSSVKLEILRDGKTLTFDIKREKIVTNPVVAEKLENNIGYISLSSFDEETSKSFEKKFEELKSQNITSLIIDLRNNGGGIVDEAIEIANCIADKDSTLLITVDKNKKEEITKSKKDPIINMPIVVLVNENTASASEILAGALKDLNKATIVGKKTYGKGVIQQFITLSDGSGLKITSEEYFTPNRTTINKVGIEPNEVVELPDSVKNTLTVDKKDDTQLQKAIEILKNK